MTAYFERSTGTAHLEQMRSAIMPREQGAPVGTGRQANVRNHVERIVPTGLASLLDDEPFHHRDDRRDEPYYKGSGHRLGGDDPSDDSQEQRKRRRYQVESISSFDSHSAQKSTPVRIPRGTPFGVKVELDQKPVRRFGLDKSHLQALSQFDA
jgi:hypothetical protein